MGLIVRDMRQDDFESVARIFVELHRVHSDARPDWYLPSDAPLTRGEFDRWFGENTFATVAEQDGRVVGFCNGYIQRGHRSPLVRQLTQYHIDNFAVSSEARRGGVGRALFEDARRRAAELGCDKLTLSAWACNKSALDFYAAMGMTERVVHLELDV